MKWPGGIRNLTFPETSNFRFHHLPEISSADPAPTGSAGRGLLPNFPQSRNALPMQVGRQTGRFRRFAGPMSSTFSAPSALPDARFVKWQSKLRASVQTSFSKTVRTPQFVLMNRHFDAAPEVEQILEIEFPRAGAPRGTGKKCALQLH